MSYQNVFARYEMKYLISKSDQARLKELMQEHMKGDCYGKSVIRNLYFDTPDFLLIRRSLERPVYKEKLRLRSYCTAAPDSVVFAELKKKCQGVVYKRRISLTETAAMDFLCRHRLPEQTQIANEISFCLSRYNSLKPVVFISSEREAFYGKENPDLRITFDENILWRDDNLSLRAGVYGNSLLDRDQILMEAKISGSLPLWLTEALSGRRIYKTSFSKYGRAYQALSSTISTGGLYLASLNLERNL